MEQTFKLPKDSKEQAILLNNKDKELPKYLYHYTSFATLFYLMEAMNDEINRNQSFYSLHASAAKSMDDLAEIELYEKVFEEIKHARSLEGWNELFILSLSEAKDNMMMWDAYADKGKGVCLKLDVEQLLNNPSFYYTAEDIKEYSDILPTIKEGEFNENVHLAKSQYNLENEEYTTYRRLIKEFELKTDPVEKMNLLRQIRLYSAIFKRTGYESEKEWRFLIESPDVRFKSHSRMGVVAYTTFSIPARALNTIILGPRTETKHSMYLLRLLREKKNLPALNEIEISNMSGKVCRY